MRKLLIAVLLLMLFLVDAFADRGDCGSYHGHALYRGPRGGCYYMTKSGNKEYVDRGLCKC